MTDPHAHVPRIVDSDPPELVVYDREQPCPYLKDRSSRLPLRLPSRPLTRPELEERLQAGDRRQGYVLYRPACNECRQCEAIRLPVQEYRLSKTQARILRRAEKELEIRIAAPSVDERRVELYNRHKSERGLGDEQPEIDAEGYRAFLVASSCDTFELSFWKDNELIGVAICDRSSESLSAVYCCYDPQYSKYSLGTISILHQLSLCKKWSLDWLYLGLYISGCQAMEYKARYLPHQRLINDDWVTFER
ncbi:MAG: arginyltransferase [Polyangiaceae bacterium]|nr:arginyltransferase [Polyangiaceae bacterium]